MTYETPEPRHRSPVPSNEGELPVSSSATDDLPHGAAASDAEQGWHNWPLASTTDTRWAKHVLAWPEALLADHVHLERKAASNALDLLGRWPWPTDLASTGPRAEAADLWMRTLASIARDESAHLTEVLGHLHRRGCHLVRWHENPYAAALRKACCREGGRRALLDRVLVSALIEARSCERFGVLAQVAQDESLRSLYAGLRASEAGHHRQFLRLADVLDFEAHETRDRYKALLIVEADAMAAAPPRVAMHGGFPTAADASTGTPTRGANA